jgi:CRISPR-associated protein Cas1
LINDPRCPRCSLQPICLPDEVNYERTEVNDAAAPRKLWPPRDDGIHLVVQRRGTRVGVRGATMTIVDDNGQNKQEVPLANVESPSLLGAVQLSTQAMHTLADRGIPVTFLSSAGRLVAMLDPLDSVRASTRRAQVRQFDNPAVCLELSGPHHRPRRKRTCRTRGGGDDWRKPGRAAGGDDGDLNAATT